MLRESSAIAEVEVLTSLGIDFKQLKFNTFLSENPNYLQCDRLIKAKGVKISAEWVGFERYC